MDDEHIVELYWKRDENAIAETATKYGNYLKNISYNILQNHEDAMECVSDTYQDAWNAMPPHHPSKLSTFLGKITRRISIDCLRRNQAEKRGGGEMNLVLEELEDCLVGNSNVEKEIEQKELVKLFNEFLRELPVTERRVFLCRYWYLDSVKSIAKQFGFSQSKVTSMLHRTRGKLREQFVKEGF